MDFMVTIDVPSLAEGVRFYESAFGFREVARPLPTYAVLASGARKIGIIEKPAGSSPAKGTQDVRRYARHWTPVHLDFHPDDFAGTLKAAEEAGAVVEQRFEGGSRPPVAFCADPFGNGFCIIGRSPGP